MTRLRLLIALLLAPALLLTTGASSPPSRSIPLPDDFAPEGIAVGPGSTFYVGSLVDGDIYRGDLRTGKGSVFIDVSGRFALGMKVDERHHRLFVAGGPSGRGYVYDLRTGRTLRQLRFAPPGTALVNDVTLTRHAAYFTDSFGPKIYKVPLRHHGRTGRPRTITVTGPAAVNNPGGFGLNGIAAAWGGRTLIVDHSDLGALFTVDPRTGRSRLIRLARGSLVPGTPDGILLDGRTLWVVENFANTLVKVRLARSLRAGRVVAERSDPLFRIPSTVAQYRCKLAVVNTRFDLGLPPPLGSGAPPGTEYDIVVLKKF
jgi:hypothetical protein